MATMARLPWTPWHKVVELRKDLMSGELTLAVFAADLYEVVMGRARPVYQDPMEFFSLTYPTFNLRELARDIVGRLAGKNERAVRQLELTYGGGKTHALITLFHLVNDPTSLPDIPAVNEFKQHIGLTPPPTCVAVLPFDKLDVEKGMEVRGPANERMWLRHPWSAIAFQLAGEDGLRLLHAAGEAAERESSPAENLLADLLSLPGHRGQSTLLLIDEVLMFAREKVNLDPRWRGHLLTFFQCLTQAATKVDRCAIVASLLATDPRKSDSLGKEITQELHAIFGREREEGIQPVTKQDVAEVLRRRFFTGESIRDREAFRPHVVAALKGIQEIDEQTRKEGKAAEDRYLHSYPFHPDLTDVLYTKWTNLEGFQRTRGVLRTFALALRRAVAWDQCPLVAANVFLGEQDVVAEAARELAGSAAYEEFEGPRQEWTGILQGELAKARDIHSEIPALRFREVEQAVVATFLHSQPIGQKALTRELLLLLGHTRPDRIELEKALRRWAEVSWFLDDTTVAQLRAGVEGGTALPKSWRLGAEPNLAQMHHDARARVSPDEVERRLVDEISKHKALKDLAGYTSSVRLHVLPPMPDDVKDDGDFHYAILGAAAACDPGKPSAVAHRFTKETTGPDRPRVCRNAVVLAAPSRDGIEHARDRIRDYLAWEEVRDQLKTLNKGQKPETAREALVASRVDAAKAAIPGAVRHAYCIVVTVSASSEVEAFRVTTDPDKCLFRTIIEDGRTRVTLKPFNAEALLPAGPYDLWREDEPSRPVSYLVRAFAESPRLPKMLESQVILDTLVEGCAQGIFVLKTTRPDRSTRTYWRERPDAAALKDPTLEAVLPKAASLSYLPPSLVAAGSLPGLWEKEEVRLSDLVAHFGGSRRVRVSLGEYDAEVVIPHADRAVVEDAVRAAVKAGLVWLTSGPASILAEDIPMGLLNDQAVLRHPPQPLAPASLLPETLPQAWEGQGTSQVTTGIALAAALSEKMGELLPWSTVRDAIDGALRARMLETTGDSAPWPCDYAGAQRLRLRLAERRTARGNGMQAQVTAGPVASERGQSSEFQKAQEEGLLVTGEVEMQAGDIQNLADNIADVLKTAPDFEVRFLVQAKLAPLGLGGPEPTGEALARVASALTSLVSTKS